MKIPPVAVTLIDVVAHVSSVEPVLFVIPAVGAVVFDVTVIPPYLYSYYHLLLLLYMYWHCYIVAAALLP